MRIISDWDRVITVEENGREIKLRVSFRQGESMVAQGKRDEVKKMYGKGMHQSELGKGNGNWLFTKRADVTVNGISCRDFVLDHYGRDKLTDKLAEKFADDLESGKITFDQLKDSL